MANRETEILEYLKTGKELTARKAMTELNCYSLTSAISRLRKQGYNIVSRKEPNIIKQGWHAVYTLEDLK